MNTNVRPRLVLATTNPGKLAEFKALISEEIDVVTATVAGVILPPETGNTLAENARVKAVAASDQSGVIALADDSGLEVDALGGRPGIFSARYAGPAGDDRANRAKLLAALANVPSSRRGARFRCAVAIATPDGRVTCAEGVCEGTIAYAEAGANGFGYDPLFLLPDGRTLADFSMARAGY